MRVLAGIVAAVLMLVAVAVAFAGGTSPAPVISYIDWHTGTDFDQLYVTGPGGTHRVGDGQDPSVAPDGLMVSSSAIGSTGPSLTIFATSGRRLHSFFRDRGSVTPLAWSPDSRYLAVWVGKRNTPEGEPVLASAGLAVIDTKTMSARIIASGIIWGASFAPSGPDRLVYGYQTSPKQAQNRVVNLYTVNVDGSERTQLTTDGDSFHPLWTGRGVVYDRGRRCTAGRSSTCQLWLLRGGDSTPLTPPESVQEILPVAASANGNRLIVDEYAAPAAGRSMAVQVSPRRVRTLGTDGTVVGVGISRDGRTVLLDRGDLALPPRDGVIETVPFGGGQPTRIATGDSAAWNG
jgi:WD40 repeat protein